MIGAIAGDIIGSVHEGSGTKRKDFRLFDEDCRFTDDTVLTIAVAAQMLHGGDFVDLFHDYFHAYPHAGYGSSFIRWAGYRRRDPYNSWGNGSAMRVSPVGFAFASEAEVLLHARLSAEITHDHPEGIRGAQATALAVFLARTGHDKTTIRARILQDFGYNLERTVDDIRPGYTFDVSCQGSVPEAIIAFLDADSFEDAIRNAVSLGGDSDTMACIAGGIAEAYYGGVPAPVRAMVAALLPEDLARVTDIFRERFP